MSFKAIRSELALTNLYPEIEPYNHGNLDVGYVFAVSCLTMP